MSEEWCTHGPSLNCKDCEIERLEADAENLRNTITSTHLSLKERDAEIERLRVVVDAARDFVNNHMDHDDAMRIFDALVALDTVDQQDTADGS